MEDGSGQGEVTHPRSARRFQGLCRLFKGGAGRENVINEKDRLVPESMRPRGAKDSAEVQSASLPAQETLRSGGAILKKPPLHEAQPLSLEKFVDACGDETGLIELPLETALGIQGDGDDRVIGDELGPSGEETVNVLGKNSKESPPFSELDFMENFFEGALIAEEGPSLVTVSERDSYPLFRGKEF